MISGRSAGLMEVGEGKEFKAAKAKKAKGGDLQH